MIEGDAVGMDELQEFVEESIVAMFRGLVPSVQLRRMARWVGTAVGIRFRGMLFVDEEGDVLCERR